MVRQTDIMNSPIKIFFFPLRVKNVSGLYKRPFEGELSLSLFPHSSCSTRPSLLTPPSTDWGLTSSPHWGLQSVLSAWRSEPHWTITARLEDWLDTTATSTSASTSNILLHLQKLIPLLPGELLSSPITSLSTRVDISRCEGRIKNVR